MDKIFYCKNFVISRNEIFFFSFFPICKLWGNHFDLSSSRRKQIHERIKYVTNGGGRRDLGGMQSRWKAYHGWWRHWFSPWRRQEWRKTGEDWSVGVVKHCMENFNDRQGWKIGWSAFERRSSRNKFHYRPIGR